VNLLKHEWLHITPLKYTCLSGLQCFSMSTDFHSSNPFRRKAASNNLPSKDQTSQSLDASSQPLSPLTISDSNATAQVRDPTKPVKKVRLQSPPPSSPDGHSIPDKPPTPIPRYDDLTNPLDDPFERPATYTSDASDDETPTVKTSYIPTNPFQKTLATLEHTENTPSSPPLSKNTLGGPGAGRASLDVEAFKRLLMTGSVDTGPAAITTTPLANTAQLGPNYAGSITDASSSASRHSIFETIPEARSETPRTSHEVSDTDDERRRFTINGPISTERRKPPPPSSKHGKLIKVELKDQPSISVEIPASTSSRAPQQSLASPASIIRERSPIDLHKPLPAAPTRASHEGDRESIFDRESAGKTPEPPSPSSSVKRKFPPVPPLSRRHSQLVADSKSVRSTTARLQSNMEEEESSLADDGASFISQSSVTKPPPPPPSRRPGSIRTSTQDSVPSPMRSSLDQERPASISGVAPIPPPARRQSNRQSGRPASVLSMDMNSKRASTAPPPPPPRQRASSKASTEGIIASAGSSRRASHDLYRTSTEDTRGEPLSAEPEEMEESRKGSGASNILADLSALQREVDALRGQYEMKKGG
jgi:hypothetical protein